MTKYRRKPMTVEAESFHDTGAELVRFIGGTEGDTFIVRENSIGIRKSWGIAWVRRGDWVIKGPGGELLVYDKDAFDAAFEKAPDLGLVPRQCIDMEGDE